jgi:hypothetical protein
VRQFIALLTPNELIQVFPVEKVYDGYKYKSKDFHYTMRELEKHGLDTPIGENLEDVLWDYTNREINRFSATYMCLASHICESETGKGIIETFLNDKGVKPLYMCEDSKTGKQFLYDKDNHKTYNVKKPLPRGWKVIEGAV